MIHLNENTIIPKKIRHIGCLPACIALDCADIGEAQLPDGSIVTITWGRNLEANSQKYYNSVGNCVYNGSNDGLAEIIIDEKAAEKLKSILVGGKASWITIRTPKT